MVCDIIPATREVTREWSRICDFFGGRPEMNNSLHIATSHFLACFRRNAFDLILIASAFRSLGRSEIRATKRGF
jgi:hypothetical protein